ncbi:NADP-dependent phosphogluconate dehydrogenase [Nocardioides mangrovicus]|uniref:6-phosphogluconate dehydrogenase, decarboxylating n=1 Tax=Nocardioides mangrovicus TaxID=2478913 RepID=A0A3L8NY89_9ACTN|nr:NADP-dependent phosphogluconate dehydrogenase [Nocardioides mangrovicus]RLV47503.1 NADP-dependent phosphogluconate dehydrogenase [Nocardioides mangrovicus]
MTDETRATADIGLTGLAVMGSNLARNMARHGHTVAVHNRTTSKMTDFLDAHGSDGDFVGSESLSDFVASIKQPRAIIIMVKAGEATDAVIDELTGLLDDGDILVDAGNAHFADTVRRQQALEEHGIHFVGMGVSGGEEGALNGPSIMVGGSDHAYERLGPIVEDIAAQVDGTPCAAHVGPDGAGHFVKMVHNGIEYADMQLIAEAYDVLRSVAGQEPAELAEVFRRWNEGDLESFLIEIAADVLAHVDADTGRPFVDVVADSAEQKGTGRWTVQVALDLGVPVTGIAEAVFARSVSGHDAQREAAQKVFEEKLDAPEVGEDFVEDVRTALFAAKVVAYAQGFDMIVEGSNEHDWGIHAGEMATIWRGGCIIRAKFLDRIREAFDDEPDLTTLMTQEYFATALREGERGLRRVVTTATAAGVPVPGFAGALSYFDALRRDRLPAALIQGLRDNFGAHTYERVDRDGTFHTQWATDDRKEVEA